MQQIQVVLGNSAYTPTAAEFTMPKEPGEKYTIEVLEVDADGDTFGEAHTFGPYVYIDALTYAQSARHSAAPVVLLAEIEKRHSAAHFKGNDYTGLLDNVRPLRRR